MSVARDKMKVACALITHLRVKAELKRQPHLEDLPTIIVDRSQTRPLVIDSSPKAPAVAIGTTLEQALSHQPNAIVVEADDPHYRRVFQQVLTTLLGVSDRVEAAELGTVYVGIDGLEPMYGGEARLVTTLLNAVPRWLNPRIGVGEGKFPALVAARTSRALGATRVPPDPASFLSLHSVGPAAGLGRHPRGPAPVRPAHPGANRRHEIRLAGRPVRPGGLAGLGPGQR